MWEYLERIGLLLMVVGFVVLGWQGWKSISQDQEIIHRLAVVEKRLDSVIKSPGDGFPSPEPNSATGTPSAAPSCDQDCVRQLVSEAIATISNVSQPVKQEVIEKVVEKVQTIEVSKPQSQYISLGSGGTTNTTWTNVSGSQITFNIDDLGKVIQVFFEVQLESPSGRVFARLWDERAGHIVIGSEVSHVAGEAKLISTPVTIPSGGRTIIIQLRSETQQPVKVLSSRLRVDTQ